MKEVIPSRCVTEEANLVDSDEELNDVKNATANLKLHMQQSRDSFLLQF